VTVFLDGMRLVSSRSFADLTAGASLVALFAAIALIGVRELWGGASEAIRTRVPALVALALPLALVTVITIVARFVELAT